MPVVLYGAERREPYNRVRLSSLLSGELGWDALTCDLRLPEIHWRRSYPNLARLSEKLAQRASFKDTAPPG